MRCNLLHIGADELHYEIRAIVDFAETIQKETGQKIIMENIGDPIAAGETIPQWMKDIVMSHYQEDESYGYSPSKGLLETRQFLANAHPKKKADDIIFFNGLWEAINKLYTNLRKETRIIGPNPAYSTHSSAEAAHAGSPHITYRLNPRDGWNPDIHELRNKVKYNPNIGGILVVNPDNPTGAVFRKEILEEIVAIAREFDTFVIFDEIYSNMIFDERDRVELADIIGDVPGIAMKGMSKEMPWPGGRCGWIEIYNKEADTNFSKYIDSIVNAKMLEVCSTTHPQKVLPTLYSDVRFDQYLSQRKDKYQLRADRAIEILSDNPYINVVKPKGSFYLTITFSEQWEKDNNLVIPQSVQDLVIAKTQGAREDKRFVYQLIANKGICCVPLSEFNSDYDGIRLTLLQEDLEIFENTLHTISQTIYEYHGKQ